MFYELAITKRTLRDKGILIFLKKFLRYFIYIILAVHFKLTYRKTASIKKLIDSIFNHSGGIIAPIQVKSELFELAKLIKKKRPKRVLEIGTMGGGTLFLFCALAHPQAKIASIDYCFKNQEGGYAFWRKYFYRTFVSKRQKLHLLWGNSHNFPTVSKVRSLFKDGLDLLFIDGDHSYIGVKQDFENYSPMVKNGGLIILHDICKHPEELNCHVDKFWHKIKQGKKYLEIIENPKQGWAGIGIIIKS